MTSKIVTSKAGGTISYRKFGQGPGVIILHGGLQTWKSHQELAEILSNTFTVYLPDRRGRGLSSAHGSLSKDGGSMQTEISDLEALAEETGARFIYGLSSGALICLQTILEMPHLFSKAVLYEPPLLVDRERFNRLRVRFENETDSDLAAAMHTAMDIMEMGPWIVRAMPLWFSRPLLNWAISSSDSKGLPQDWHDREGDSAERSTFRSLVPTLQHDFNLVRETEGPMERYSALKETRVLLLSGTASPPFLRHSCEALEKAIPNAKLERFKGLDHLGSGNKNIGGRPEIVAQAMKNFFADGET